MAYTQQRTKHHHRKCYKHTNKQSKPCTNNIHKQTLEEHITETDPVTGEYNINLPAGNYTQEVLQLEHYYYIDENFQLNSDRRDSIETIKTWTPQSETYKKYGPAMGLWLIETYTYTTPKAPQQFIEEWAFYARPIKYWFQNKEANTTFAKNIIDAFKDIHNKTGGKVKYEEVYTEPEHGIKIYFKYGWEMPEPAIACTYITKRDLETRMILVSEEYYDLHSGTTVKTGCREHMRSQGFGAYNIDNTSVLWNGSGGGNWQANGLNYEDAMLAKYVHSMRQMPKDMSRHDTTTVKEWKPNAIKISGPTHTKEFTAKQNHPNPFNNNTTITYSTPTTTNIKIDIYNIEGKHIQTLINKKHTPGTHKNTKHARTPKRNIHHKNRSRKRSKDDKITLHQIGRPDNNLRIWFLGYPLNLFLRFFRSSIPPLKVLATDNRESRSHCHWMGNSSIR